eukprot:7272288-Prymnesium_polylepis.1
MCIRDRAAPVPPRAAAPVPPRAAAIDTCANPMRAQGRAGWALASDHRTPCEGRTQAHTAAIRRGVLVARASP